MSGHSLSSTPNYHLRENPIVCHLRENHLRENHASVSSTRNAYTYTTRRSWINHRRTGLVIERAVLGAARGKER